MPTTTIIVVACVFGGSFLLMIPLMLLNRKNKSRAETFRLAALETGAIVNFYGDALVLNGVKPVKGQDYVLGEGLEKVIRLYPGVHTFRAKFSVTDARVTGNKTFTTDRIDFELPLELGMEYIVGICDDLGEENKTIFSLPLRTVELIGRTKYLICERKE